MPSGEEAVYPEAFQPDRPWVILLYCTDGFLGAYWRRPAAYLDPRIRAAISCFWALGDATPAWERLADDIASGTWAARYADLLHRDSHDLGYRLVVARG